MPFLSVPIALLRPYVWSGSPTYPHLIYVNACFSPKTQKEPVTFIKACSNINHKCRKRTAKCTNSEEEKTKRSELNNSGWRSAIFFSSICGQLISIFERCLFPVCLTQDVGLVWHSQGCGCFHHKLTKGRHCILYYSSIVEHFLCWHK